MMKSLVLASVFMVVFQPGCLFGVDSGDGIFTGNSFGCADFVVLRENASRLNVLEISNYSSGHNADTTYEVNVKDWPGTVRVSTFDRPGGMGTYFCNDVAFGGYPQLRSFQDAVSGRLTIRVRGFRADTTYFNGNGSRHVQKAYSVDAELHDAVFRNGLRIERARIDSVSVGWLAG